MVNGYQQRHGLAMVTPDFERSTCNITIYGPNVRCHSALVWPNCTRSPMFVKRFTTAETTRAYFAASASLDIR